jgi:small subunit ribosomal protein S5e
MTDVEEPVDDIVAEEEAEEVEEDAEDEEEFVGVGATEIKLFGKWSFDDIEIRDISLEVSAVED